MFRDAAAAQVPSQSLALRSGAHGNGAKATRRTMVICTFFARPHQNTMNCEASEKIVTRIEKVNVLANFRLVTLHRPMPMLVASTPRFVHRHALLVKPPRYLLADLCEFTSKWLAKARANRAKVWAQKACNSSPSQLVNGPTRSFSVHTCHAVSPVFWKSDSQAPEYSSSPAWNIVTLLCVVQLVSPGERKHLPSF